MAKTLKQQLAERKAVRQRKRERERKQRRLRAYNIDIRETGEECAKWDYSIGDFELQVNRIAQRFGKSRKQVRKDLNFYHKPLTSGLDWL